MRVSRLLFALALFLAAGPVLANDPAVNSTVPSLISLVGLDGGGVPAASGQFTVIIRDLANNPVPGVTVRISLATATDVAFCATQPDASLTVDCAGDFVTKIADQNGAATFTLTGRGTGTFSPGATGCSAQVFALDRLIRQVVVTTFDPDGSGDVGGSDLGAFLGQFWLANGSLACDYDNSGFLGGGDLSFWLGAFATGEQIQSGGTLCP